MYFAYDENCTEFEEKTLNGIIKILQDEGSYYLPEGGSFDSLLVDGNSGISIIKGTKIKVKVTPAKYEEVVTKPVVKKTPVKKGRK